MQRSSNLIELIGGRLSALGGDVTQRRGGRRRRRQRRARASGVPFVITEQGLFLNGLQRRIGHAHPLVRIEKRVTGTSTTTAATTTTTTATTTGGGIGFSVGGSRIDVDGLSAVGQRQIGSGAVHGPVLGVHGAPAEVGHRA